MPGIREGFEHQVTRRVEDSRHEDFVGSRFGDNTSLCHVSSPPLEVRANSRPGDPFSLPTSGGTKSATHRPQPAVPGAVRTSAAAHPGAPVPDLPRAARANASRHRADLFPIDRPTHLPGEAAHAASQEYVCALDRLTHRKYLS